MSAPRDGVPKGPVAQGIALPKDAFVQWLEVRLDQDADFARRMGIALRQLRVDRIAASIRSVRARATRQEPGASA